MSDESLLRLDSLIADLQRRLEDARRIRDILGSNPELADVLFKSEGGSLSAQAKSKKSDGPEVVPRATRVFGAVTQEYFDKIVELFHTTNNNWLRLSEIIARTELSKNAAIHVLYKTHSDRFEKMHPDDSPREIIWRLKPEVLASASG